MRISYADATSTVKAMMDYVLLYPKNATHRVSVLLHVFVFRANFNCNCQHQHLCNAKQRIHPPNHYTYYRRVLFGQIIALSTVRSEQTHMLLVAFSVV